MRDGERGLILKCWGGCGWREVRAELRRRGLVGQDWGHEVIPPFDNDMGRLREAADAADRARRIANALDLFLNEGRSAAGTLVATYLRSRGLVSEIPATIRVSSRWLRHQESGETRPAMVALVEHTEHGQVGCHLTYLAPDGSQKATLDPVRRFLGPVAGGAVRLAAAAETLMVGEGIESCLAAMQATALPAWAAVSTSGLRTLVLPSVVRTVIILADNDLNSAGERAARNSAMRWLAEGKRVRLAMPPTPGTDFNDVIMGARLRARNMGNRKMSVADDDGAKRTRQIIHGDAEEVQWPDPAPLEKTSGCCGRNRTRGKRCRAHSSRAESPNTGRPRCGTENGATPR